MGVPIAQKVVAVGRITVGATAVRGDDVKCHSVMIKALCSGQTIDVGIDNTVTSGSDYQLADGAFLTLSCRNLNEVWFEASAAAQEICYLAFKAGE